MQMRVCTCISVFISKGCHISVLWWHEGGPGRYKHVCQCCPERAHPHGIMLKGGSMDSVVPCVQVGVQERVASGEHLCVGAVHVPAVGSGCQVWMSGMCMCASSAALQGDQRLCVRPFLAENTGTSVRCHRERWVPSGLPCVCVAAFTSVRHQCVPAHLQSLGKAVQCSSTKPWQCACAGKHPWEHPGLQGLGSPL